METDVTLYAKCSHLIPHHCILKDKIASWDSKYEFCPECLERIEIKQKDLQQTFENTFGDVSGSSDKTS